MLGQPEARSLELFLGPHVSGGARSLGLCAAASLDTLGGSWVGRGAARMQGYRHHRLLPNLHITELAPMYFILYLLHSYLVLSTPAEEEAK